MLDSTESIDSTQPVPYRDSREKGKFLSQTALGLVLKLHAEGKPQTVIASLVGVNQATVSKALKRLGSDSSDLARHHLKARAFQTSRRLTAIAEKGKPDVALKAAKLVLLGSGVISDTSTVQVGVQVIIGTGNQPALQADSVEVEVLDGTPTPST